MPSSGGVQATRRFAAMIEAVTHSSRASNYSAATRTMCRGQSTQDMFQVSCRLVSKSGSRARHPNIISAGERSSCVDSTSSVSRSLSFVALLLDRKPYHPHASLRDSESALPHVDPDDRIEAPWRRVCILREKLSGLATAKDYPVGLQLPLQPDSDFRNRANRLHDHRGIGPECENDVAHDHHDDCGCEVLYWISSHVATLWAGPARKAGEKS